MRHDELNNEYFNWMYQLVYDEKYTRNTSYRKLLSYLHHADFICIIGLDSNRAEDGMDLRYRFGYERGYEDPIIATYLDNRDCSVLEMMIALAVRCEDHIMSDSEIGNRTGKWFWGMTQNLGLVSMMDHNFDSDYVEDVLFKFLTREYKRNGEGGLFTLKHCSKDLRSVEIWYQMMWYLDEIA